MKLHFLAADRPLTKHFALDPVTQALSSTSYPNAYEFTSIEETVATHQDLATKLQAHGAKGHCLLKGQLQRPLRHESRAGSTSSMSVTTWACLDLDGADYPTPDAFMATIGWGDVSYVVQWSASSGLKRAKGLRCHIFVLLEKARAPELLKRFLLWKNLTVTELAAGLELTASGVALSFKLDISTCQNDKLIYISPPVLGKGVADPHPKDRVHVVMRARLRADVDPVVVPGAEQLAEWKADNVNRLRKAKGLKERKKFETKLLRDMEYMPKPGVVEVTGVKEERDFVYFNLNGGDSWGYYHPKKSPEFIFNFKGEPVYKTSELMPEYYRSLHIAAPSSQPDKAGRLVFGIRDRLTSKYYSVIYEPADGSLEYNRVDSEGQLRQFLKEHGRVLGDVVPTWTLTYDPKSGAPVDAAGQILNVYQAPVHPPVAAPAEVPPTTLRIITHALGGDRESVGQFLNWLAFVLQVCSAPGTAWLLQGVPGTGKGLLCRILEGVFGPDNVTQRRVDEIASEFMGWVENRQIVFIDEMDAELIAKESKIMAKLKTLITEPMISVRKMHTMAYLAPNYAGWIFASNMPNPVQLAVGDRRFNVGAFQEEPIEFTPQDYEHMLQEIPHFHAWLRAHKVDELAARRVVGTEARHRLIDRNQSSVEKVSSAIKRGNIQFLWDQLPSDLSPKFSSNPQVQAAERFRDLMFRVVKEDRDKLSRDELQVIFAACVDNVPKSPTKFTNFLGYHGIDIERVWLNRQTVAGIKVKWNWTAEKRAEMRATVAELEGLPKLQAVPTQGAKP